MSNSTPQRVLVVDDDQAIRNLLCAVLKRRGLEVDYAENGADGLAKLTERPYAIILLDLMMPLVDGHLFLQRLRDMNLQQRPVVLVISASDESDFRKLERGSVSAIIRKPFDILELADLVGACADSIGDDSRAEPDTVPAIAPDSHPRLQISVDSQPAPVTGDLEVPDKQLSKLVPLKKT